MSTFEQEWKKWHPNSPPIGHMMRSNDEPNWVRLHSLPLSKRYADTAEERETLLRRQNALAYKVLGVGLPCWLVQSRWLLREGERDDVTDEETMFSAIRTHNLSCAFRFLNDEREWDAYASATTWQPRKFDDLLWAIANEEAAPIIWMSAATGSVFAPYDGGVDLFLAGPREVRELLAKYSAWLPTHPEGL